MDSRNPTEAPGEERMQLRYCERCGALRVVPAQEVARLCSACARALRWIYQEEYDVSANL